MRWPKKEGGNLFMRSTWVMQKHRLSGRVTAGRDKETKSSNQANRLGQQTRDIELSIIHIPTPATKATKATKAHSPQPLESIQLSLPPKLFLLLSQNLRINLSTFGRLIAMAPGLANQKESAACLTPRTRSQDVYRTWRKKVDIPAT